jgi:hypothetical protein
MRDGGGSVHFRGSPGDQRRPRARYLPRQDRIYCPLSVLCAEVSVLYTARVAVLGSLPPQQELNSFDSPMTDNLLAGRPPKAESRSAVEQGRDGNGR